MLGCLREGYVPKVRQPCMQLIAHWGNMEKKKKKESNSPMAMTYFLHCVLAVDRRVGKAVTKPVKIHFPQMQHM